MRSKAALGQVSAVTCEYHTGFSSFSAGVMSAPYEKNNFDITRSVVTNNSRLRKFHFLDCWSKVGLD